MSDGTAATADIGLAPTSFSPTESPEEFWACQRLAEALLPPHRFRALVEAAGGLPSATFSLPLSVLQGPKVALTEKQIERLKSAAVMPQPAKFLSDAERLGARVILSSDPSYPSELTPLPDSPALLFVRGTLKPNDIPAVAIVGSRRATTYGKTQAERFAAAFLERGLLIVSGGAMGIDTAAHQAVVQAGGRTIAVLGCGIDITYPSENRALFARIIAPENGGALISEFALGTRPEPWRFPTRNRIIAGIARLTLILESPESSGSLLTASDAARYGREVWVVPGPVDNGRSRGGHKLIQDGASLADSPEDVLIALGNTYSPIPAALPMPSTPRTRRATKADVRTAIDSLPFDEPGPVSGAPLPVPIPALSPDEARLYEQINGEPCLLETAGERAGLAPSQATVAATLLEMKALIQRLPGGLYLRASQTR